ncbi:MAG: hypothetical protein IJP62_06175 [Treponema sp.]|nr:hypothetical protein [Treponema sp.]
MKRFFPLVAVFFLSLGLFAQSPEFPSLEPTFVYETLTDLLTGEDVIRAGLEFSLCPQDSPMGEFVIAKYKELEAAVTVDDFLLLPQDERGEKILTMMYERILNQYVADQTKIDTMFSTGTYNCVSSSMLFFALAKAAGLSVAGQETPDHAFCSVYVDGKKIDVETTNPGGFNPGTKKLVEQTEKSTKYFIVPKKYYSGRKEVGERKFVSLVGRNLVSFMNEKNNYAQAVPLSAARMLFAETASAKDSADIRSDFDMVAGNFAAFLDKKYNQSERAMDWLDAVYERWGKSAALQKNYDTSAYNCAVNYLREKDYNKANEAFEAHKQNLTAKNALNIQTMIFTVYLDETTKTLTDDEAISFLHGQRNNPLAKEKSVVSHLNTLEEYAWYQKIKSLADGGKYLEAANLADEALKNLPASRNLKTIKNQCLKNYAIDVHNEFANLANAGKYEEALAVVQKGLEFVPANAMLKGDLKKIQNVLQK